MTRSFLSFAGSLFGQLFFGEFEFGATVTGIFGILAAVFALLLYFRKRESRRYGFFVLILSILSGIGVFIESWNYYSINHVAGNDFSWEFRTPFFLALLIIAYARSNQLRNPEIKESESCKIGRK